MIIITNLYSTRTAKGQKIYRVDGIGDLAIDSNNTVHILNGILLNKPINLDYYERGYGDFLSSYIIDEYDECDKYDHEHDYEYFYGCEFNDEDDFDYDEYFNEYLNSCDITFEEYIENMYIEIDRRALGINNIRENNTADKINKQDDEEKNFVYTKANYTNNNSYEAVPYTDVYFNVHYSEYLEGEQNLIDDCVIDKFITIKDHFSELVEMANEAILEFYNSEIVTNYSYTNNGNGCLKKLKYSCEITYHMNFEEIYFPFPEYKNLGVITYFLYDECSWDDDYILAVKLIDGEIF